MELINKCKQWQAIPMELIYDSQLSLMAKAVYMLLAGLPATSEITATRLEKFGISRKTAGKHMVELRQRGWLECVSERKDNFKVYVLNGTLAREDFTHDAQRAREDFTRARGKILPAPNKYIYNINNNILNNSIEEQATSNFEAIYHYPFRQGLTYKQKVACLIDGVNGFVERGVMTPEQAKVFVKYWSEPLANSSNTLRMEGQDAWKLSTRIERWIEKGRNNG